MRKLRILLTTVAILLFSTFVPAEETSNKASSKLTSSSTLRVSLKTANDFNGDGKTDFSVFRPSNGFWYVLFESGNYSFQNFGLAGDTPIPEDFDGDRKADIAVWRKGVFYVLRSSDNSFYAFQFGIQTDDPTVCRDYDGDGKADFAVYRGNGTGSFKSFWYVWRSSDSSFFGAQIGDAIDVPAPGDYDGDGKADLALFYGHAPYGATGLFFTVLQSSTNSFKGVTLGVGGDVSVPGDYDGDGKTDFAVWRPSDGIFLVMTANGQTINRQWGKFGDKPVPGDYDGDGATDFAVWRPDDATFYVLPKSGNIIYRKWGLSNDIPTANYQIH